MAYLIRITIDNVEVNARPGQTILQAASEAGIYIPHLCYHPDLPPHGSCRVCTVKVNGRFATACTLAVDVGMEIVNENDNELNDFRRAVIEMLFAEGNHICPACERSGNCELQAIAYRLKIPASRFPYIFPQRETDSSHPEIFIDRNRCIQCGRCVSASRDSDGKHVFGLIERGISTKLGINSPVGLKGTNISSSDKAAEVCPVGAINIKGTAFRKPVGKRKFDEKPIGSEIEAKRT